MTRKQMKLHGALHSRADVDRLYVSRKKGGRGLWSIADVVPQTSEWLRTAHLKPTTEALITAVQDQALNTNWHSCQL